MKYLLPVLLGALSTATAYGQSTYQELPEKRYGLTQKAQLFKKADTLQVSQTVPVSEDVLVVGKQGESLAVVKRAGFIYYVPNRYIKGFGTITTTELAANRTEEYCMVMATQKLLSTQVTITVDYGQRRSLFSDARQRDETGRVQAFNSSIDPLNYMNGQGWLFVNAYSITVGSQNVYHYVMRRPVVAQGK